MRNDGINHFRQCSSETEGAFEFHGFDFSKIAFFDKLKAQKTFPRMISYNRRSVKIEMLLPSRCDPNLKSYKKKEKICKKIYNPQLDENTSEGALLF